ncbi:MAG TPA: hybrid sensor histidine kinase/response regulator [Desulfobulbaceae bacterium]|nr:hybrid sensor histidine kinase/response regulator [Desulfobulbaceae bacterium]
MKAVSPYFWLSDEKGWLRDADEAFGELLGYSRTELLELHISDIDCEKDLQAVLLPLPQVVQREARYRKKNGAELQVSCSTRYLQSGGGQYIAFVRESGLAAGLGAGQDLSRLILDAQCSSIVLFDMQSKAVWLNNSACESSGRDFGDCIGLRCRELWKGCGEVPCRNCLVKDVIATGRMEQRKMTMMDNRRWRVTGIPIEGGSGRMEYVLFIGDDITEYLTVAKETRQNHKLQSLGTLAGGIAHDFNNILSGIVGYTELSLAIAPEEGTLRKNLLELAQAGKRATELVRQILTFSRRGEGKLVATQLPVIVKEVLQLLRSTLPSTIELRRRIDENVNPILADPVQIHQIIMNLCTNASHAMEPDGGVLTVTIGPAELPAHFFQQNRDVFPGEYLQMSVSDTGIGMSQEVMASIFDPYFTTKPLGQGTGLGLSLVHGIVKDCGGHIAVDSAPGKGSTFTIYFPTVERSQHSETGESALCLLGGTETIMVVDDEPVVLKVTRSFLELQGYKVLTETNSQLALDRFRDNPEVIDMLISDVTMPHLTGDRLARECLRVRPDLPVILMTGYTDLVSEQSVKRDGVRALLMKPLVGRTFLSQVRHQLDTKRPVPQ